MLKQPAPTMPGMTDTLDFVKNLWGSMHLPGASMPGMSALAGPPMSIEDLDKRIADMKAVESWLNLNLGMLHGTIQALEVQRGTLVTLRSMSSSMAEALRQSGVSADKMATMPFASFFNPPAAGAAARPAAAAPEAAQAPSSAPSSAQSSAQAAAQSSTQAAGAAPVPPFDAAGAAAAIGMPAAMAWWNVLQEQFTQAVTTAIAPAAPEQAAPAPAPAAPAADAGTGGNASANGNGNGRARAGRPKADKG